MIWKLLDAPPQKNTTEKNLAKHCCLLSHFFHMIRRAQYRIRHMLKSLKNAESFRFYYFEPFWYK